MPRKKAKKSAILKTAAFLFLITTSAQARSTSQKFLVILDPGHGGDDAGAVRANPTKPHSNLAEKDLTLAIALKTMRLLKAQGIRTVLTRRKDVFVGLDKRTEIANKAASKASSAVFVSIHANSSDESKSSGVETYVFNAANNDASRRLADLENGKRWAQSHSAVDLILTDLATTANFTDSVDLACSIQKTVVKGLKAQHESVRDRGTRQALFYVLMQTQVPSVLFEPGFVSNPKELVKLSQPAYQTVLAHTLVDGILKWKKHTSNHNQHSTLSAIAKSLDTQTCQIH